MADHLGGISGVVFDMDGVLVDTSPCHEQAYNRLMTKLKLPAVEYEQLAGRSTKDVVDQLCGHLSSQARQQCVSYKQTEALKLLRTADIVFADTVCSIEKLHRAGFKLALATSASKASAGLVLDRLGVSHLFEAVITADHVKKAKPDPEIFCRAIKALGLAPSASLIIEDSVAGVRSGLAAGARVVNVRNRISHIEHPSFSGFYGDLTEVTGLLMGRTS
ncbi:MAG: HAD-IA family hydrolase [Gammaproteobacteria bacterium]|nr:HAD-IA family hydrolase [Gammaproteobacteria bacterium]